MQMNTEQPAEIIESLPEDPKPKRAKKAAGKRKVEKTAAVAETPQKKPARKPAKPVAKKTATPGPKKVVAAKAEKPAGRKPGLKKKLAEEPKKAVAAKTKKAPGRKPGRKPGKKVAALVPAVTRKKPGPKGTGLVGRKADLLKMGESAFLYSLDLQRQIQEMERMIANYERVFEAVRQLFGREMDEIEQLMVGLLE
jgi:hypothetical protein